MKRVVMALVAVAAGGGMARAQAAPAEVPHDLDLLRDATQRWDYDLVGGPALDKLAVIANAPAIVCKVLPIAKAAMRFACTTSGASGTPLAALVTGPRVLVFSADGVQELRGGARADTQLERADSAALTMPATLVKPWQLDAKGTAGGSASVAGRPVTMNVDGTTTTAWLSEAVTVAPPVTGTPKPVAVETAAVFATTVGPVLVCAKRANDRQVYVCLRLKRATGGPTAVTLPAADRRADAEPAPVPATRQPRISISRKKARMTSTLTIAKVASKVQSAYLGGVRKCYAATVAKQPKAAGTVALVFTVSAVGKTENILVKTFDDDLGTCVKSAMGAWRFPIPLGEYGSPQAIAFELDLKLAMK